MWRWLSYQQQLEMVRRDGSNVAANQFVEPVTRNQSLGTVIRAVLRTLTACISGWSMTRMTPTKSNTRELIDSAPSFTITWIYDGRRGATLSSPPSPR